uniref:Uncharacterized protein n=1 Tax=Rhizophora mucronata TaxID=61149 RepID=A0A2P2IW77_RHIMU
MCLILTNLYSIGLFNIHFFFQEPIQKGRFHIHLIDFIPLVCC